MTNKQQNLRDRDPFSGKLLLDVNDVARALSCSPRTIYNQVSAKTFEIPVKRRGKSLRFHIRDVLKYVDSL